MRQLAARILIVGAVGIALAPVIDRLSAQHDPAGAVSRAPEPLAAITVDYPSRDSIFPPEITPPTFIWRDPVESNTTWSIDVSLADGSPEIHLKSLGERMRIGEIDPRCIAPTNELPKLTPQQAASRSWTPDDATWSVIKEHSVGRAATLTITGFRDGNSNQSVSRGRVTLETSPDPVGAPIFYRDVPLMPSELQKGVIKPLAPDALPLIAWRLRYVGEGRSRVMMEGLHTCANCHSFSRDGKTMGLDMDGPQNDKGMYALVPISRQVSIRSEDVIKWSAFRGKLGSKIRVGFMSQVSPDGQYVINTIDSPETSQNAPARADPPKDLESSYYVANFKDYRFLQVFYPTRGILAWYSRATGLLQPLPGADDPSYVQTNAVWSPDGRYLVFARAKARDSYPEGAKLAEYATDPNETAIQYDLYRIPFTAGKGGTPEPVAGASHNAMSNAFPKISPDGRWIVFVECHNGLLMRPDSQLYIVAAEGGEPRRMRCNTPLMNSWHSFSPNGRWLVFSSKSRSPYTQMYLTHLDEQGRDSPAILIDNATAANRAVNLPEFVNIPQDGLLKIDTPAVEFYRLLDRAWELAQKGQDEAAIAQWKEALKLSPKDAKAHNNLGVALAGTGKFNEAIPHFEKVLEVNPGYAEAHNNLGVALARTGRFDEAIVHYRKALELNPGYIEVHNNIGTALLQKGRLDEAIAHFQKVLEVNPDSAEAHYNLGDTYYYSQGRIPEAVAQWRAGLRVDPNQLPVLNETAWVLATCAEASVRNGAEAVELAERAVRLSGGRDPAILDTLAAGYAELGRFSDAVTTARRALAAATEQNNQPLGEAIKARIAAYAAKVPFRETPQRLPSMPLR